MHELYAGEFDIYLSWLAQIWAKREQEGNDV